MDINRANMNILYTAVSTRFARAFEAARETDYQKYAMTVSMASAKLEMPWLEQLTGMREWIGPRVVNNLATNKLTVTPRDFELTYAIPRKDIEDEQYGMYMPFIDQMAASAANLPNDICGELLNNAASATWADGNAFFGTTRKYGEKNSTKIVNYTTSALSETSLKNAYDAMTAYRGQGERLLHVKPTLLLHGPSLRWTVKELLDNPQKLVSDSNGAAALPNPVYNLVQHLEIPDLEGSKWLLLATGGAVKPIVYFEREVPNRIVRKDRADDDNVFFEDRYLYGCSGRGEAAFIMPHLAYFGNVA